MTQAKFLAPIVLIAAALLFYAFTFTVRETEVAIKLRLGEIVGSEYEPGLHWRIPVLNKIEKFDSRIQTLDARPQRFLTVEKKDVIVDSYAKWRITNPGQFYRSTGGDSARTGRLLSERVNTALRDQFGKRTIQEVVSEDRIEIMKELTDEVDSNAAELGIEVVDVRVKKIDLPQEVSESVYQRMRAERERVARDLRAQGKEAAERIEADADRQRTVILANAYKQSQQLRGEGDAKSAGIYADAFERDPEFYSFHRSLSAYRSAFGQGGDIFVLEPESDFFRFFNDKMPAEADAGAAATASDSDKARASSERFAPNPEVSARTSVPETLATPAEGVSPVPSPAGAPPDDPAASVGPRTESESEFESQSKLESEPEPESESEASAFPPSE